MRVHRQDGQALEEAVGAAVLAGGGVDADGHPDDDAQDRGAEDELGRDPHAGGDLVVDAAADDALAPVPVEEDAAEPPPPPGEQRSLRAEVHRFQRGDDLPMRQRGLAPDVIRIRVQKPIREEVCHVGGDEDHHQPTGHLPEDVSHHFCGLSLWDSCPRHGSCILHTRSVNVV